MKGMRLAERYFKEVGWPMLNEKFARRMDRIAAGLAGDGSECFGFDDALSRDHDWGPGFCIWLTKKDFALFGTELQDEYKNLPGTFLGLKRADSQWGSGRVGVFEMGQFFKKYMGMNRLPENMSEWRALPEQNLAACTNGKVFHDPLGEFTRWRNTLLAFYPEDIRLKKMASRCMTAAQAGQYNFLRLAERSQWVAAQQAVSDFIAHAISLVFLMNKQYVPFYKWSHHALKTIPVMGESLHEKMEQLVRGQEVTDKITKIEEICAIIIERLIQLGLSSSASDFLLDHGLQINSRIKDQQLKAADVWLD